MLLIYNTSHNNRHQNQGEKFVSPLAWCAHTHTQNTTLQTPLSNQCEDFIGMCHFGCTTAVLHTYTHTYTHHQSRASHIQICTCSASALSLMIGLVSDVYCASLALSLSLRLSHSGQARCLSVNRKSRFSGKDIRKGNVNKTFLSQQNPLRGCT